MPRMSGWCSSSAAMNLSASVLMPRSMTSKPAPSSIIPTRFLPMSWMSPLTVPMTTLPTGSAPVSARSGRRIAMPAFIAFAARRTSGTNRIPSRKSMPTIFMPGHERVVEDPGRGPAARQQDVRALDDLVGQAVVEVVVHLLGELVVGQRREVDLCESSSVIPVMLLRTVGGGFHDAERCRMMERSARTQRSRRGSRCPESSPSSEPSPCSGPWPTGRSG